MAKKENKKAAKQAQKQKQTTQQLVGVTEIKDNVLCTNFGDMAFFSIKPSNISVLSDENLGGRIYALMTVLKGLPEIEILCLNSKENFETNKSFLRKRLKSESKPNVRELLQSDSEFLDIIQSQTASSREFLLIVRLRNIKEKEIFQYLNRIEKTLSEQNFSAKLLVKNEIKTLLAVYFEQNVTTDNFDDFGKYDAANKSFVDLIAPSVIKFFTDYYICGNTFRSVWALREYPTSTQEQALLRYLGEKENVSLKIYARQVTPLEEKQIIANAANKNKLAQNSTNNLQQTITAESNLQDVATLAAVMHRNREPLFHTAVFIEMLAQNLDELRMLQTEVQTELVRSKLNVDRLVLRQQQGFMSVSPSGRNVFREQFERVLPASSTANLYPFSFSGKTDESGFYLGRDKFGSNIICDFDKRSDDKTNANALILGNSGQGKSYLLKLILTNFRMSGKNVICLDPESEYMDLTQNLGGCYIDLMSGEHIINVLEPKSWGDQRDAGLNFGESENELKTFCKTTKLSQHISFLRDFFACYKDFTEREIDTIEMLLVKLYDSFGITDSTDFDNMTPEKFPILSDLYEFAENEFKAFSDSKKKEKTLYTADNLQNICLGINSICVGADSKIFNGYTNITDDKFITFGVKGLLQASKNVRNAMLFNVLSYMSNELLTKGNTVASIDEFYLLLTNLTAVEYIRNFMKRVRKKESAVVLASQNIEDFLTEKVRELTKPLFAIPTHQFLFNAGTVDATFYMDALQIEPSEFELIRYPQRGVCLYKCGNDRYNLMVKAPEHKAKLFGTAGGR
jgi:hypothetical protein